jgi:hypothetical protein
MSFDYSDFDVLLNVRAFYRLSGFLIVSSSRLSDCDLLVVLRGIPPRVFCEYTGPIHFYDYVLEHKLNLRDYFPNATFISIVSLSQRHAIADNCRAIYGYLPVIPSLWYLPFCFLRRSSLPLHVSNYKPLADDPFQLQIISLVKEGKIRLYGSKWDRIQIHARPLSYLSANIMLNKTLICFGLMYPYQRGKSLSGRMWQAPIQGCVVISEKETNPFLCPGVITVESFSELPFIQRHNPAALSREASEFWLEKTKQLANDLDLLLDWNLLTFEVIRARWLLLKQHFEFNYYLYVEQTLFLLKCKVKQSFRLLKKSIS